MRRRLHGFEIDQINWRQIAGCAEGLSTADVIAAAEDAARRRISKLADMSDDLAIDEQDGWDFGSNRRDVGSLQIDQLTCAASDLARRNLIAVHPVTGWWKAKGVPDPANLSARFALVVEIDAGTVEAELYAEVEAAIVAMVPAVVAVGLW